MPEKILVYVQGSAIGMVGHVQEEFSFVRHFWVDQKDMREDAITQCEKRCKELNQGPHLPEHWKICLVNPRKNFNIMRSDYGEVHERHTT